MTTGFAGARAHAPPDRIVRQLANVNYAQWERTRTSGVHAGLIQVGPGPGPTAKPGLRPISGTGVTTEVHVPSTCVRGLVSACRQIWGTGRQVKDVDQAERVRLLQLRIQARRKAICDYKIRYVELIELNQEMRNAIVTEETGVHEEVKLLLRKYEKFRGGISVLNSQFSEEYTFAELDLESTRARVNAELEELRLRVNAIDEELQVKQKDLNILTNYKDKEYPVKTIQMNDLKKEMETLTVVQGDEQEELATIIGAEQDKMQNIREKIRNDIISGVTDDYLAQMHPSLQDMAFQNVVMKKEMDFHRREIEILMNSNKELEKKVNALRRGQETNVRMKLFPQLYPLQPVCTPEMDVILDIPKQEWLPI